MYFPHSYGLICSVHYEYMERTFFKQRQQEIKSSSITVVNILLNCWWLFSLHCNTQSVVLQPGIATDPKLQWALTLLQRSRNKSRTCQFRPMTAARRWRCCRRKQISPWEGTRKIPFPLTLPWLKWHIATSFSYTWLLQSHLIIPDLSLML